MAGWLLGLGIFVAGCEPARLPDIDRLRAYQPGGATVLVDRLGQPFADLSPIDRSLVELEALPPHVANAFVAVEDKRFYKHKGVDVWRVGGAAFRNLKQGGIAEGFSTITMQLARNVFSDEIRQNDRTLGRKMAEIRAASQIEKKFTKQEILELYLNHIYFGNGAVGIEAASRHYFRKSAAQLNLSEAALLAALPKAPSHYDPRQFADKARSRRNLVLRRMADQGLASAAELDAASQAPLGVRPVQKRPGATDQAANYFVEEIRRQLEREFGERLYSRPLTVYTTLDIDLQHAAEDELIAQLATIEAGEFGHFSGARYVAGREIKAGGTPYLQGAVVAMEVTTGDVLAWVGGRDARQSEFDRVLNAHRQAGSSFKPFVYAAAITEGKPLTQILEDQPFRIQLARNQFWEPKNFSGDYDGPITMRNALVRSVNVATVRLAEEVGYRRIAELARQAGIRSTIDETPAMALGTVAVSPLELVAAYTSFAGLGRRVAPRLITRIEDGDGRVIRTFETEAHSAISPSVAYLINDALHDALLRGSGAPAMRTGFSGPASGKTGTTSDGVDAWFVGYTPEVVAGVWIGFDDPKRIVAGASGGRLAAPVWGRMMDRYYGDAEPPWWPAPANVIEHEIDPESGRPLEEGCRPNWGEPTTELFIRGTEPASICPDASYETEYTWFNVGEASSVPIEGWWTLEVVVTDPDDRRRGGHDQTYRIRLEVDGDVVYGDGELTRRDGDRVNGGDRISLSISGRLSGDHLRLRVTEFGVDPPLSGRIDFDLDDEDLDGDFNGDEDHSRGYASARRIY